MKIINCFMITLGFVSISLIARAAGAGEAVSQSKSVSVLSSVSNQGATITSSIGDRNFTIEIKRGPETPLSLRKADPLTPQYEIDIRILDEVNFPIFSQFGGHAPIDSTWAAQEGDPYLAELYQPSELQAQENFILVAEVLNDLDENEFVELKPEFSSLRKLIPTLLELSKRQDAMALPDGATFFSSYRNRIAIHDAPVPGTFGRGRHGATLLQNISSSGTVLSGWTACNHGRCPAEMPRKCRWTSALNRPYLSVAPLCSTPYSFLSRSGKHNSNDDTEIQYDGVRGAYTPSPTSGKCSDSSRNDRPNSCW